MSATSRHTEQGMGEIAGIMEQIGRQARAAAGRLAKSTAEQKVEGLRGAADTIRARKAEILAANAVDMEGARARRI